MCTRPLTNLSLYDPVTNYPYQLQQPFDRCGSPGPISVVMKCCINQITLGETFLFYVATALLDSVFAREPWLSIRKFGVDLIRPGASQAQSFHSHNLSESFARVNLSLLVKNNTHGTPTTCAKEERPAARFNCDPLAQSTSHGMAAVPGTPNWCLFVRSSRCRPGHFQSSDIEIPSQQHRQCRCYNGSTSRHVQW